MSEPKGTAIKELQQEHLIEEEDVDAWDDGSPIEDVHQELPGSVPVSVEKPELSKPLEDTPPVDSQAQIPNSALVPKEEAHSEEEEDEEDVDAWDDGSPIEDIHHDLDQDSKDKEAVPGPVAATAPLITTNNTQAAETKASASAQDTVKEEEDDDDDDEDEEDEDEGEDGDLDSWDERMKNEAAQNDVAKPAVAPETPHIQSPSEDAQPEIAQKNLEPEPAPSDIFAPEPEPQPQQQQREAYKGHRKRFSTSQVFSQDSNDDFFSGIKPDAIPEDEENELHPMEESNPWASENAHNDSSLAAPSYMPPPQAEAQPESFVKGHRKRFSTSQVFSQSSNDEFFSQVKPEAIEEDEEEEHEPTEEELAAKWEAEMAAAGLLDDPLLEGELMDDDEPFLEETPIEPQQQPQQSLQEAPRRPSSLQPSGQSSGSALPSPVAAIHSLSESMQRQPERPTQAKAQSFVTQARGGYESPYDLPMDLKPKKKPSSRRLVSSYGTQPTAPLPMPPPMSAPPAAQNMAPPPPMMPPVARKYSPAPTQHMPPTHMAHPPPAIPTASRYSPAPTQPLAQPQMAPPPPVLPPTARRYSPAPTQQMGNPQSGPPAPTQPPMARRYSPAPTQQMASPHLSHPPPSIPTTARYSPAPGQQHRASAPPPAGRSFASPPRTAASQPREESIPEDPVPKPFAPPPRTNSMADIPAARPFAAPQRTNSIPAVPVTKARGRAFSQTFNYIAPTDGREQDPLQRWRGGPVFAWGAAGTVITTFPKEVPRYSINSTIPMIQPSPGEVKIRNIKEIYPLEGPPANFPGPLKGKGKKKEVVAWLTAGIEALEKEYGTSAFLRQGGLTADDKRRDERIVLWKVLRVLVDNDGMLEGKMEVDKVVRDILAPELDGTNVSQGPQHMTDFSSSSITRFTGATPLAEPVDPVAVDGIKKYLLTGEREKAVWEAVDHRLWAHAMLIASTLSPDVYRKVAQEFIQKEIKQIGDNTESLAMLYEVFAGNHEESIDELVPPSARAGLQMLSTSGAGPSKGVQEGLDRWRESLGLILSNRTIGDNVAIHALGKLLASYDRPEAAHICFLFARSISLFAGVDNENSDIVLVGADHKRAPFDFDKDLESIELTEVYEYGLSLAATTSVPVQVPHLAAYKLQHAKILASFGLRTRALEYCESIANLITSQTKRSPYHNTAFTSELDDLIKRLKQSPNDQASSWIAKPTMDKVSSSVWTKFNKFVAGGDDEDEKAEGADGVQSGPFAGMVGGTPTISRAPSVDQFGHMAQMQGGMGMGMGLGMPEMGSMPIPSSKPAGRYAPGGGASAASSYTPQNQLLPAFGSSYGSQQGGSSFGHQQQAPPFRGQMGTPDFDTRAVSRGSQQGGGGFGQAVPPPFRGQMATPDYDKRSVSRSSQPGRYAPVNPGSARTSLDQGARPSFEHSHSGDQSRRSSLRPSEEVDRHGASTAPPAVNPYAAQGYTPYAPQSNAFETPTSERFDGSKEEKPETGMNGGYNPMGNSYAPHENTGGYTPYGQQSNSFEPLKEENSNGGYNPPEDNYAPPEHTRGYTPPSYEPNTMGDAPESEDEKKPKKKSFMDDDEDDWGMKKPKPAADSGREKTKAEKDREADEAFRRAAEEDAKKGETEQKPQKKGWGLGGWFKKSSIDSTPSSSPQQSQPGKPIRAKLGEESSFYYDPDLKRWVNKKAGKEEQAKSTATPPPPKGPPRMNTAPPSSVGAGPARTGSAPPPPMKRMGGAEGSQFGAASSVPSRTGSPAMMTPPGMATPPMRTDSGGLGGNLAPPMQRSVSALSQGSEGSSAGPGSRPGTASSGVLGSKSTIDDLLGPPVPRKRGEGGKKKRQGRYIDVMADKAGGA